MNSVNGDYLVLEGLLKGKADTGFDFGETQIGVVAQTGENNEDVGIGGFGCSLGLAVLNVSCHRQSLPCAP